ncbi:MAG: choice-of-anchor D domain-containing protein [Verrucomicrobia bacterium]|nr:choice-of-anchor D domain-containing protein [Verrucomicrobiota bacterium]
MHRPSLLLASLFLLACAVPHLEATVTLQLAADRLNTSSGTAAPSSTLVLVVADTTRDGLATAVQGSIATGAVLPGGGLDDLVVFRTDLSALATPGVLSSLATGIDFSIDPQWNWDAGDPLYLLWFPSLTTATTSLSAGVSYGLISLGSTPPDGGIGDYRYVSPTNTGTFGSTPIPSNATNTAADQTSVVPPAPEIALSGNGSGIVSGTTVTSTANHTDFGSTPVAGGSVVRTFTITNSGTAPLTLSLPVSISGPQAAEFTLLTTPSLSVAAGGGTTTFQVSFDPAAAGSRSAVLSFDNNDADENPFSFAIGGTGTNSAPTDIALSNATLAENGSANAVIGSFSATDADPGDSHTYSLVTGTGSTDNSAFNISGSNLRINAGANFEAKASYSVRVRATDNAASPAFFEKAFVISVTDVNEAPSNLLLGTSSLNEGSPVNTTVGVLSATDPDAGEALTYSLQAGTGDDDNSSFTIAGAALKIAIVTDFETKNSYSIRVRATDSGNPGLFTEATFTISILDVDETPGEIVLSDANLDENSPAGSTVGSLSLNDPIATPPASFTLVAGDGATDNAAFAISGSDLKFSGVANFEAKRSYSVRIRSTDRSSTPRVVEETFVIAITDLNEAPTNLQLSALTLSEDAGTDALVGALSVSDPDAGDLAQFALVPGTGDTDNAAFSIQGSGLRFNGEPDFETKSSYQIRIEASDSGTPALSVDKAFTITVRDVNEPPTFVAGANQSLPAGTTGSQSLANWATAIDDGDALATQALSFSVDVVSGASLFAVPPAVSPTGTLTFRLTGSPGLAELSVTLTDDASINGTSAIESSPQTFSIAVTSGDITVTGNGFAIGHGDATPDSVDDTDFGIVDISGGGEVGTFTLTNAGDGVLTLGTVVLQGTNKEGFTITQVPDSTLDPGAFTTLEVTFDPATVGERSATVVIPSNDPDRGSFTFAIEGVGGAPDIVVEDDGTSLQDGSTLSFASVALGGSTVKTLSLRNAGAIPLTGLAVSLDGPDAEEFVASDLTADSLNPMESVEIALTFTPASTGQRTATLRIDSDDPDEAPFLLTLSCLIDGRDGKVVARPDTEAADPDLEDSDWESGAAGLYEGLLYVSDALKGAVSNLRITAPSPSSTAGGTVSATVRLNRTTATLRGSFDSAGRLVSAPGASLAFDLQLRGNDDDSAYALTGTVTLGGVTADAYLPRTPYSTKIPVPEDRFGIGPYTLLLPSNPGAGDTTPGGDGWATANLSRSGSFSVTGRLGDNTRFTETAYLTAEGELFLFTELYPSTPGKGLFGGKLTLRDLTGSDLDGRMQWIKALDTRTGRRREHSYPEGFSQEVWAIGCRFTPPLSGVRALDDLADQYYNAEISLIGPSGPGLNAAGLDAVATWFPTNQIKHFGPRPIDASVNPRNGSFTGTYSDAPARLTISFDGVVFQKQEIAAGVFINANKTGAVRIKPGVGLTYPGSEDAGLLTRLEKPSPPASAPNLTPEPTFPSAAAGTYNGVLSVAEAGTDAPWPLQTAGGLESIVVTSSGGFSGALWLDGARYSVRGTIGQTTTLSNGITLELTLSSMTGVTGGFVLEGAVTRDTDEFILSGQRRPTHTRSNPSPWKNSYTMAVCAPAGADAANQPAGDGYGSLSVAFSGSCSGMVTLADGTKVTLGGHIGLPYTDATTQTAIWSFHRGIYGRTPKGYVAGAITFRTVAGVSSLDGEWRWVKQGGASPASVYPDGIDITTEVLGSIYVPPAKNVQAMTGLDPTLDNVWLRFSKTDLSTLASLELTGKDLAGTWQADNKIIHYGPQSVTMTFNASTGLLTGTYKDTANGINFSFGGALIQSQNLLTGSFLTQNKSGLFVIEKR